MTLDIGFIVNTGKLIKEQIESKNYEIEENPIYDIELKKQEKEWDEALMKTRIYASSKIKHKFDDIRDIDKAKYQLETNRNEIKFKQIYDTNIDKIKNDFPLIHPNKEKNNQEYNFHVEAYEIMLKIFEKYENQEYEILKRYYDKKNLDKTQNNKEFEELYNIKQNEFENKVKKLWNKYPLIFENELENEKLKQKIKELEKQLENKRGRPKKEEPKGNITDLRPRLEIPSSQGYDQSLEISNNKKSLKIIDEKTLNAFDFIGGKIRLKGRDDIEIRYQDIQTKEIIDLKNYDTLLLKGIYSIVSQYHNKILGNFIEIKRSILANYLGVNVRGNEKIAYPIIDKLKQFQNVLGVLSDNSVYRVLNFSSYNSTTDIITLDIGFILELKKEIEQYNPLIKKKTKTGLIEYKNPDHNKLLHSSIVNEKNKPVVEIIVILTNMLLKSPNNLIKPLEISCQTILDRTTILKNTYEYNNNKNRVLKRAFDSKNNDENLIIKLLKEKTNTYDYFKNLKIKITCPSSTTLKNSKITMLHDGVNAEYNYD